MWGEVETCGKENEGGGGSKDESSASSHLRSLDFKIYTGRQMRSYVDRVKRPAARGARMGWPTCRKRKPRTSLTQIDRASILFHGISLLYPEVHRTVLAFSKNSMLFENTEMLGAI